MNVAVIARNVGIALMANGMFMALSTVVSIINGVDSGFSPLFLSTVITMMVGVFPLIFMRRQKDINIKEGLVILMLSWILSCVVAMLPYVLWGGEFSLANAWFESVSGITTTGATILNNIEALPKSLLFWRSSTHYIGGLGVVVFMMMILPSIGSVKFKMSKIDIDDVSKSNYKYKSNQFIRVVVTVYLGITVTAFLSLVLAGMPAFDALNHAMSVVATGGFSTKNTSIAAFNSPLIELILVLFMIISSLHFGLIYASFATRSPKVLKSPVTRFYLFTIVIAALIVAIDLLATGTCHNVFQSMRYSLFEVASTISTTGFAITDTNPWPILSFFVLIYVSIQCGCSGSTTSGLRTDRVWILAKATRVQLLKIAHPNAVIRVKSGNQVIENDLVTSAALYMIIYLFLAFIFAILYSVTGFDLVGSIGTSVSMMSNVGPGFGDIGSSLGSFSEATSVAKFLMSIQMLAGRLGLYSVLVMFVIFKKKY